MCLFSYKGFIEFIVEPSLTVMGDLLERILLPSTRASSSASGGRPDRDSISEEKTTDNGIVKVKEKETNEKL